MTARARYHAIRAYVRAVEAYERERHRTGGWSIPAGPHARYLDSHVRNAWHRLPDTVKSAVQPPEAR